MLKYILDCQEKLVVMCRFHFFADDDFHASLFADANATPIFLPMLMPILAYMCNYTNNYKINYIKVQK